MPRPGPWLKRSSGSSTLSSSWLEGVCQGCNRILWAEARSWAEAGKPLQQGAVDLVWHLVMGAVARLQHHLGGRSGGMALEGPATAGGIDPGIADPPEQQQGAGELGKQLIEGLAPGDVEHGAEYPEGTRIQ